MNQMNPIHSTSPHTIYCATNCLEIKLQTNIVEVQLESLSKKFYRDDDDDNGDGDDHDDDDDALAENTTLHSLGDSLLSVGESPAKRKTQGDK
jgi:hypothetical protein